MPVTSMADMASWSAITAAVWDARVATECASIAGRPEPRAKARAWSRPKGVSSAPGGRVSSRRSTLP